ncbi:MAG: TolB family protein, partial [Gemmatimonadales bacterium]
MATMLAAASRFVTALAVACAVLAPSRATAQQTTLPHLAWRTLDTRYFRIYFTRDAEEWTRDVAARIDGAHDAVSALVGSAPHARVTVIVEDPNNVSNGFALPLLDQPLMFFWPTPPDPSSPLGNGAWSDQLSIHEFAHIAHLTRESRNPGVRRLTSLLPARFGPVALSAPRWVVEGYATFVEGRVVRGIGRPNGVWRPAILRQWAIEGQLPSFAALDGSPRFEGGDMAYLAGSAFLEWLAARNGDSSVVHLWRRMTARTKRSFSDAFTGVYGAPPDELYGRFTAALTHDALEARADGPQRALVASSADGPPADGDGELVQRLHWATGAPALARDDSLMAMVLSDPRHAPRVVIVSLVRHAPDSAARLRAARERELDPEDVPAIRSRPSALTVVARLGPRGGMSFAEPRFFADGNRLLVTGLAARGDGVFRRDLFVWNWRTGSVRRVTHGVGIRHADVSPDGLTAIADRCGGGYCDLVRVTLANGAITTLAQGDRTHLYNRPRISRDGVTIAFALQKEDGWHVATMPAAGGEVSIVEEGSSSAYAPEFARGGA